MQAGDFQRPVRPRRFVRIKAAVAEQRGEFAGREAAQREAHVFGNREVREQVGDLGRCGSCRSSPAHEWGPGHVLPLNRMRAAVPARATTPVMALKRVVLRPACGRSDDGAPLALAHARSRHAIHRLEARRLDGDGVAALLKEVITAGPFWFAEKAAPPRRRRGGSVRGRSAFLMPGTRANRRAASCRSRDCRSRTARRRIIGDGRVPELAIGILHDLADVHVVDGVAIGIELHGLAEGSRSVPSWRRPRGRRRGLPPCADGLGRLIRHMAPEYMEKP